MTSLAFMLVWVPLPVCQTDEREVVVELAVDDLVGGAAISVGAPLGRGAPSSALTRAAAFLTRPSARIISRGMRSSPIRKLSRERAVCAPQ